jgi:hypothetical protein
LTIGVGIAVTASPLAVRLDASGVAGSDTLLASLVAFATVTVGA